MHTFVSARGSISEISTENRKTTLEELSRNLQESKARLEEAQRVAYVGHWEWDLETDVIVPEKGLEEIGAHAVFLSTTFPRSGLQAHQAGFHLISRLRR